MALNLSYVTKTEELPGSLTRRWAEHNTVPATALLARGHVTSASSGHPLPLPPLPCSAKIVLHLKPAPAGQPPGPSVNEDTSFIRISFRKGGKDEVCAWGREGVCACGGG